MSLDAARMELGFARAEKIRAEAALTEADAWVDRAEKALFNAEESDWAGYGR